MTAPTDTQVRILEACRDAGLRIWGPTDAPGMDGVVVRHSVSSPKLSPLRDGGYRLCPCGPDATNVEVPRDALGGAPQEPEARRRYFREKMRDDQDERGDR